MPFLPALVNPLVMAEETIQVAGVQWDGRWKNRICQIENRLGDAGRYPPVAELRDFSFIRCSGISYMNIQIEPVTIFQKQRGGGLPRLHNICGTDDMRLGLHFKMVSL